MTCVSILGFASIASASEFDWKLLQGRWAESVKHQYACRPDNVHMKMEISGDRKTITFKLDRPWEISGKRVVTEFKANVLKAEKHSLVIQYFDIPETVAPEMRAWEMRWIGPSTYRWRAAGWDANTFNGVIGVLCPE
jgi:hypothetical protein